MRKKIMFSRIRAWLNGRIDGKRRIPLIDDPAPSPYEQRICKVANQNIEYIHGRWADKDAQISAAYNTASERYKKVSDDYESKRKKLDRDTTVERLWHYYLFAVLIGLCEMAANIVAFKIFGESNILTFIMALSILIGIPLSGHALGKSLKQGIKTVRDRILLATAVSFVISCLVGFAFIRKDYIAVSGLNIISPRTTVFVFICWNIALFLVCAWLAFISYDSDPQIYRLKKDYMKYQKLFNNAKARRNSWSKSQEGKSKAIREVALEHIQIYRSANLRKRFKKGDITIPESFKSQPDIPIPSFDWEIRQIDQVRDDLPKTQLSTAIHERAVTNDDSWIF
ncbi:MAG: hypothetical protein ACUVWN_10275 [bacterium]